MIDGPDKRVHLVGSLPLASASEVFAAVAEHVGADVARIPDGETGERATPFFARPGLSASVSATPGLVFKENWDLAGMRIPLYGLAADADPATIELGALGFASAAQTSYRDFRRAREGGRIAAGTRMQVSLPTPLMLELTFIAAEDVPALWPAFERAMRRELEEIVTAVRPGELAIQWDICPEITEVIEGNSARISKVVSRDEIVTGIARITGWVPAEAEVGWHLCYGDNGQSTEGRETQHLVEPADLGKLVALANDLFARIDRPVDWVHMPVPRERDDEAYFAPLRHLKLPSDTRLFLGLVHQYDGLAGAERRIAAARPSCATFGIGTECGMGRRRAQDLPALLDLHHQIAATL